MSGQGRVSAYKDMLKQSLKQVFPASDDRKFADLLEALDKPLSSRS
jgi:hypothetical protein